MIKLLVLTFKWFRSEARMALLIGSLAKGMIIQLLKPLYYPVIYSNIEMPCQQQLSQETST